MLADEGLQSLRLADLLCHLVLHLIDRVFVDQMG